jgi:hypothetical protein
MPIDKNAAIQQLGNNSSVSNQESLVKKLQGPTINKKVTMIVPGGKNLTDHISRENLPMAVFTWLRRCRHFKDVEISFINDYSNKDVEVTSVMDFNTSTKLPQWEIEGKKWLADRISEILLMENVFSVKVNKSGIEAILDKTQSFTSESSSWEPKLIFTPHKPTGF